MDINEEMNDAIALLMACEQACATLYQSYATCFTTEGTFWTRLAEDEISHAAWVQALREKVAQGTVSLQEDRFSPGLYADFLSYLQRMIADSCTRGLTLFHGLSVAVDVETTMVENSFFEIFESDAPAVRRLLTMLHAASEEHLKRVKEKWEEQRAQER